MSIYLFPLIEQLQNHPQVSSVWLFGSVAIGKDRKDSDIDLAILFEPDLSKQERFDLRLSIASDLSSLAGRDVDIVDMQAVPLFLQHQIRKNGRLLVEKNHAHRVNYVVQSQRDYFDLVSVLELRNKRLIEKALGGK